MVSKNSQRSKIVSKKSEVDETLFGILWILEIHTIVFYKRLSYIYFYQKVTTIKGNRKKKEKN